MKFKILNKKWSLKVVSDKAYAKLPDSDGSIAVTYVNKRKIYFSKEGTNLETIVHELVHAYMYELCTHSADLDDDSIEEIFAELMSKFGKELLNLAEELHEALSSNA